MRMHEALLECAQGAYAATAATATNVLLLLPPCMPHLVHILSIQLHALALLSHLLNLQDLLQCVHRRTAQDRFSVSCRSMQLCVPAITGSYAVLNWLFWLEALLMQQSPFVAAACYPHTCCCPAPLLLPTAMPRVLRCCQLLPHATVQLQHHASLEVDKPAAPLLLPHVTTASLSQFPLLAACR